MFHALAHWAGQFAQVLLLLLLSLELLHLLHVSLTLIDLRSSLCPRGLHALSALHRGLALLSRRHEFSHLGLHVQCQVAQVLLPLLLCAQLHELLHVVLGRRGFLRLLHLRLRRRRRGARARGGLALAGLGLGIKALLALLRHRLRRLRSVLRGFLRHGLGHDLRGRLLGLGGAGALGVSGEGRGHLHAHGVGDATQVLVLLFLCFQLAEVLQVHIHCAAASGLLGWWGC
mmetsp:Transcript_54840/g.87097  ORF Transcript_54840/g.87097 Transcript_54840/m.87097 type:complete len:230 (+) Transcript_54840:471-1160(+)